MMATIPATPNFLYGMAPSVTTLNNLAQLAKVGCQFQVGWKLYKTSTASQASGGTASVSFQAAAWNPDGVWSSSSAGLVTIQTQGVYEHEFQISFNCSTAGYFYAEYHWVAGANNPQGAGTSASYGTASFSMNDGNAQQYSFMWTYPGILYVDDTLQLWVATTETLTLLNVGAGQTYNGTASKDFGGVQDGGCVWTGRMVSIGGVP